MEKNKINPSTVRWLKKRIKNLSDAEIIELASEITKKYLKKNKEKLEKQAKWDQRHNEEAISKELLFFKLFSAD